MSLLTILQESKSKLTSLLSFANETTGQADTNIGDAIRTLCDGYGGGVSMKTGEIVFSQTTSIPSSGYAIVNLWESKPKAFFMFIEKDEWEKIGTYANNHYSSLALLNKELFNTAPLRKSGTEIVDYSEWNCVPLVSSYTNPVTDQIATNYPLGIFYHNAVVNNESVWNITDTGIVVSRFSSAGTFFYGCKYKWVAFWG